MAMASQADQEGDSVRQRKVRALLSHISSFQDISQLDDLLDGKPKQAGEFTIMHQPSLTLDTTNFTHTPYAAQGGKIGGPASLYPSSEYIKHFAISEDMERELRNPDRISVMIPIKGTPTPGNFVTSFLVRN